MRKKGLLLSLLVVLLVLVVTCGTFTAFACEDQYAKKTNKATVKEEPKQVQQYFPDLSKDHWGFKAIQEMKKEGIIKGDADGNFYPERYVVRAEFAAMIVRALHLSVSEAAYGYQTFVDVPPGFWASKDIEAAKPYLTGYQNPEGQLYYNPGQPAVREDVFIAMVRVKHLENEQPDLSVLSKFVDAGKISDGLKGYVAIAVKNNLVEGRADRDGRYRLNPQDTLSRAEAAAFLYRIVQAEKVIVDQKTALKKVFVGQSF